MRVVGWNIRAGGGRRVEAIARQVQAWDTDVLVCLEARGTVPGLGLAQHLAEGGLVHQRTTVDPRSPAINAVFIASRWPLTPVRLRLGPAEPRRWLPVRVLVPEAAGGPFALGGLHVPNFVPDRARKFAYLDALHALARRWRGGPAMLIGDTNTGRAGLDEESPVFDARHDAWMVAMARAGWPDIFRERYPQAREFTWYSPNAGNGFRLDQAFVNRALQPRVVGVRHEWGRDAGDARRDALSDHAALIVDLVPARGRDA
ncbi:MAG: hypothetical protein CVU47_12235 [Chloroflexi bacterium HGW-Chloroflexi-9]|nr:MAG: hypothetical protein CVU47_12235 [Chloroflexi bacterium HGW-Chloroflexi-9]